MDDTKCQYFDAEEYQARLDAVRTQMESAGVDVLMVTDPADILYLSGFDSIGHYAYQFLAVPMDADPVLFVQAVERSIAADRFIYDDVILWNHGDDVISASRDVFNRLATSGSLGMQLESRPLTVRSYLKLKDALSAWSVVDCSGLITDVRMRKSPQEIAYVKEAARLSDIGIQAALDAVQLNTTENDVDAAVNYALSRAGSQYPATPLMISSGPNSAYLHGTSTGRTLETGDAVTLELAGVAARYHANVLRTAVVGECPPLLNEIYGLLVDAVQSAEEACRPGTPVAEIDRITRKITQKYDSDRLHRTGYGLEIAYPPAWAGSLSISISDPRTLQPGMVFSIEPTIVLKDRRLGAVLGDDVLITETGHEVLTKTSHELARR